MDTRPIGVFDSGLGGLTAVRELRQLLPSENIIYLFQFPVEYKFRRACHKDMVRFFVPFDRQRAAQDFYGHFPSGFAV